MMVQLMDNQLPGNMVVMADDRQVQGGETTVIQTSSDKLFQIRIMQNHNLVHTYTEKNYSVMQH